MKLTKTKLEKILCAAIYYDDDNVYKGQPVNIKQGLVTLGYRHDSCIFMMDLLLPNIKWHGKEVQGFLTNKNYFVDRKTAMRIAYNANQIDDLGKILVSEDLY